MRTVTVDPTAFEQSTWVQDSDWWSVKRIRPCLVVKCCFGVTTRHVQYGKANDYRILNAEENHLDFIHDHDLQFQNDISVYTTRAYAS